MKRLWKWNADNCVQIKVSMIFDGLDGQPTNLKQHQTPNPKNSFTHQCGLQPLVAIWGSVSCSTTDQEGVRFEPSTLRLLDNWLYHLRHNHPRNQDQGWIQIPPSTFDLWASILAINLSPRPLAPRFLALNLWPSILAIDLGPLILALDLWGLCLHFR